VYFTGGTYNVKSLRGARNSVFQFAAPTTLNVAGLARFGFRSVVGPQYPGALNSRCIVINVAGDKVQFQPWADVTATINAPAADMQMGQHGLFQGNFTAKTVRVRMGVGLEAAPSLTTCE
jgi:hypothetical protein